MPFARATTSSASRQYHVGEQEVDAPFAFGELRQCRRSVGSLEHLIAQCAQEVGDIDAHLLVVLDHEHALARDRARHLAFGGNLLAHLGGQARQIDFHRRPLAGLAVDRDVPT